MQSMKTTWTEIGQKLSNGDADSIINIPKDFPFENSGNELRIPPWSDVFNAENLIPLIIFFAFFRGLAYWVKRNAWNNFSGFRQYRLRNLTLCFTHSVISGACAFTFASLQTYAMFSQPLHWYRPWARFGILFSISYFMHDMIDMLQYELSRFTVELILHHIGSIFVFLVAACSRKFIPYAYCALLMEVNSVTLHARTLMQLSSNSTKYPGVYKVIQTLNIATFVVFRFAVQAWQIYYIIAIRQSVHIFYACVGTIGGFAFLAINVFLFMRILASDGLLGEYGKKHAAINRDDDQTTQKKSQ
uniref:TLC domain-containing protein n=1 Tax=Panagrellus redivivus TaxID=6233 RepID=A0A7E4V5G4_PANRE